MEPLTTKHAVNTCAFPHCDAKTKGFMCEAHWDLVPLKERVDLTEAVMRYGSTEPHPAVLATARAAILAAWKRAPARLVG